MISGPTFYDVLGVSQRATQREIRAAYLRLMKENHPDRVACGDTNGSPHLVPLINRSYAALKNPQARAAYDLELANRQSTPSAALIRYAPSKVGAPRRGTAVRAPLEIFTLAALIFSLPFLANGILKLSDPKWASPALGPKERDQAAVTAVPDAAAARTQARLATRLSPARATSRSQRCFADAQTAGQLSAAELCIVFDEAFRYWHQAPNDLISMPPYFSPGISRIRHAQALSVLHDSASARADDLTSIAFRALLDEVNGAREPELAGTTAGHSAALLSNQAVSQNSTDAAQ